MVTKSNPPSLTSTAFDCPHCAAFTTQSWFSLHATPYSEEARTPHIPDVVMREKIQNSKELDADSKRKLIAWCDGMHSALVFIEKHKEGRYIYSDVHNLYISKCYNCKKISVWVHESLAFPAMLTDQPPNPDLPAEIARDFEEARTILNSSPRGAAALLRLSVQKLCAVLGEKGKNIDDDIASLVSKGLNPVVQKSLDLVRVIGNDAVHPGVIDIRDDRDTANRLLTLVNLIADQMISHPKSVNEMYETLPEGKRNAIDARNKKALGEKPI